MFIFNVNYKSVSAEPVSLGLGLVYFVASSIACGVTYYAVDDMEIAYNS